MYCLDANIIIAALRGDEKLKKRIMSVQLEDIHIASTTLCELFQGAYKTPNPDKNLSLVYDFIKNYRTLAFDDESAKIFGKDFNDLEKIGRPTQIFDLMIASVAKANNLMVVTRDRNHFKNIPDLKVEEW